MLTRTIVLLFAGLALAQAGELHRAARECDADRMRQLLSQRPSLNETDENGRTPLHVAIDSRQVACVGLLLKAGADRLARDGRGRNAFRAADEIADRGAQAAIRLHLVGFSGQFGQNATQEPAGPMPWSLEYSVMRGQTGVTKMLLDLGVDPNVAGTRGTTPLADAALKGNLEGVRLLLEKGAHVNAISQAGTQPIHDAALGDSPEVIRELAAQGADVNARTPNKAQTPLHFAAAMGKRNAVEALVALGADRTVKDSNGRTPLDAAERAGLTEIIALLQSAPARQ